MGKRTQKDFSLLGYNKKNHDDLCDDFVDEFCMLTEANIWGEDLPPPAGQMWLLNVFNVTTGGNIEGGQSCSWSYLMYCRFINPALVQYLNTDAQCKIHLNTFLT